MSRPLYRTGYVIIRDCSCVLDRPRMRPPFTCLLWPGRQSVAFVDEARTDPLTDTTQNTESRKHASFIHAPSLLSFSHVVAAVAVRTTSPPDCQLTILYFLSLPLPSFRSLLRSPLRLHALAAQKTSRQLATEESAGLGAQRISSSPSAVGCERRWRIYLKDSRRLIYRRTY